MPGFVFVPFASRTSGAAGLCAGHLARCAQFTADVTGVLTTMRFSAATSLPLELPESMPATVAPRMVVVISSAKEKPATLVWIDAVFMVWSFQFGLIDVSLR